jgi:hypothetical protein
MKKGHKLFDDSVGKFLMHSKLAKWHRRGVPAP